MSDFNTNVGLKIFNARKKLKMTRAELGKKVKLHESTIKRYEDGHIKSLDIEKLKEFASALNLSPEYLMGWEDNLFTEENFKISEAEKTYIYDLRSLNNIGKTKAITYVKDLSEIPKYKK